MENDLESFGAIIDDIAYCPDKPHVESRCRKPSPGMILDLAERYGIDLSSSYMAGDRDPDILAGKHAGTRTVRIGNEKKQSEKADMHFPTLLSFASWLTD